MRDNLDQYENREPEQPTGWNHLVRHWQAQTDVSAATDELEERLRADKADLAHTDEQVLERNHRIRIWSHAQLHARQARLIGRIRAIEAELNQRKHG